MDTATGRYAVQWSDIIVLVKASHHCVCDIVVLVKHDIIVSVKHYIIELVN